MCIFEMYGFERNKTNKICPFDDNCDRAQQSWIPMKKYKPNTKL